MKQPNGLVRSVIVGCVVAAVFLGVIYIPFVPIKIFLTVATLVSLYMASKNQSAFWQRMFAIVLGAGIAANAIGVALQFTWKKADGSAMISWDGSVALWTNLFFAIAAICCAVVEVFRPVQK